MSEEERVNFSEPDSKKSKAKPKPAPKKEDPAPGSIPAKIRKPRTPKAKGSVKDDLWTMASKTVAQDIITLIRKQYGIK